MKGSLDPRELRRVSADSLEVVNESKRKKQARADERAKKQLPRMMRKVARLLYRAALRGASGRIIPISGMALRKAVLAELLDMGFVADYHLNWDTYGVVVSWADEQP